MTRENDDYLFDRTGAPDADVERLERVLGPLGRRTDARQVVPRPRRPAMLFLVAGIAAAAAAILLVVTRDADVAPPDARSVVAEGPPILDTSRGAPLAAGAWIDTVEAGREITVGDVGRVQLGAGTRVQVRQVSNETTRLYLARGSLEARVGADARPRFFQVDTDAALCVDLGCRYTLSVGEDGAASVRVVTGQVAFETATREVFVPAGAVCVARKGIGPGTPRFEDARDAVAAAFDALDAAGSVPDARRRDLARVALDTVTEGRDTLPAWHLLQDRDAEIVRLALARIADVAGPLATPPRASAKEVSGLWKEHLASRAW